VVGVRHDWLSQETDNLLTCTSSDQSDDATSYRAGLLYLFENGIAPYASHSTSFEPVSGTDVSGNGFTPTEAQQYEVGIKYQPEGLDALFTVSAFDTRQQNVLKPGSVAGFYVQQGEIHSRGLKFEARGNMTSNLELIAAFSMLDTKVSESSDASIIGNRPQAAPDYYGSVWANYTIGTGLLEGLTIGGGVRVVGASYADDANTIKADGYTLLDAALKYDFGAKNPEFKGLEATLNVTNLLDKDYYSSCSYSTYCQYVFFWGGCEHKALQRHLPAPESGRRATSSARRVLLPLAQVPQRGGDHHPRSRRLSARVSAAVATPASKRLLSTEHFSVSALPARFTSAVLVSQ
jgi:iron complex outermembrane recepter protein